VSPFKDGPREPLDDFERAELEGFIDGNGFVLVKPDLKMYLMSLAQLRDDAGNEIFKFLPRPDQMECMNAAELQEIPLQSAEVMQCLPAHHNISDTVTRQCCLSSHRLFPPRCSLNLVLTAKDS
jgi:hypothetical protein